jgi:hypothetical protein
LTEARFRRGSSNTISTASTSTCAPVSSRRSTST